MNSKFIFFALLAIGVVLVSGCISGKAPANSVADNITKSAQKWLATPEGQEIYPNGIADKTVIIYNEDKEPYLWIVPIMKWDHMYIGHLLYNNKDSDTPYSYTEYSEPLDSIYSLSKDEAYSIFIGENPAYTPEQITEPIIVARKGKGTYWMSEVIINGEIVKKLYKEVRII